MVKKNSGMRGIVEVLKYVFTLSLCLVNKMYFVGTTSKKYHSEIFTFD